MKNTRELAARADCTIVGIGQLGDYAPLLIDGFVSLEDLGSLRISGAVGEMVGWAFDANGQYVSGGVNDVVNGVRVPQNDNPVLCGAAGPSKCEPLLGALSGGLFTGLITDESTAKYLYSSVYSRAIGPAPPKGATNADSASG